jgi:twitching motility protein PilT
MSDPAIFALFDRLLERGGSDLHLAPDYPPMMRIKGDLIPDGDKLLSAAAVAALLDPLLHPHQREQFAATGGLAPRHDFAATTCAKFLVSAACFAPFQARS